MVDGWEFIRKTNSNTYEFGEIEWTGSVGGYPARNMTIIKNAKSEEEAWKELKKIKENGGK